MELEAGDVIGRLSSEIANAVLRAVAAETRVAQLEEQLMQMEAHDG